MDPLQVCYLYFLIYLLLWRVLTFHNRSLYRHYAVSHASTARGFNGCLGSSWRPTSCWQNLHLIVTCSCYLLSKKWTTHFLVEMCRRSKYNVFCCSVFIIMLLIYCTITISIHQEIYGIFSICIYMFFSLPTPFISARFGLCEANLCCCHFERFLLLLTATTTYCLSAHCPGCFCLRKGDCVHISTIRQFSWKRKHKMFSIIFYVYFHEKKRETRFFENRKHPTWQFLLIQSNLPII